ncbi:ribosome-binding factor A [Croceimicrobium hydrocarbonivorans]|mgnify:CR=1 FL=1|uniref:Ribosome-binding factor A n=1 Tax=Croceimicrobium hydrocarbonivorans TaxID=2761580 RepID=A0A7H0VIK1_9FLAO|nr:ribosome-binding factor A [Croceimicrobium hydrocarbonivorans]QNR25549.1 ribosome-binding factor A [Croceimicrobium hydrocarbonivorans]|tara:strand:- start:587 stop:946 length:360 start_codon:yes stop_codon:yes gene_type:complete
MDASRLDRLERQVQKDLAEIFREIAQNQFRGIVFTVTRVRISPDLSIGRVNISLFPVKDKALVLDWIKEHGSLIKDRLVRKMKGSLRKVPDFYFYLDESVDAEAEIDRILKEGGDSPIK